MLETLKALLTAHRCRAQAIRKGQRLKIAGAWFQVDDIFPTGMLVRFVNKKMTFEACKKCP